MKFLDWLLNKASPAYTEKIAGGESYWNQAVRQRPDSSPTKREPSTFDPVYGLASREVAEWLERNPQLRPK